MGNRPYYQSDGHTAKAVPMSMFSGPLARLRAMRPSGTYDTQPIDPNGQSEPMGPAPMDWVQHLRRTAGLKPTAPTVDPDVYQPVQAENIQAPSGQQVYKRRDEINKQLFQLLSQGRFGDPALIQQANKLRGERGMLNDITAGENAQSQLDRAAKLRASAKTAQSGWQDLDTADYKNMSSEDLDNYIAAKRAYNDNAIAAPLEGANRIESQAGMYQNDISKASLIREQLQKYMQQNADDELNARGRMLNDQKVQDKMAVLPLREAQSRQQMLADLVRKGASEADIAEFKASPAFLGKQMNDSDALNRQNAEAFKTDQQIKQEQLKALTNTNARTERRAGLEDKLFEMDANRQLKNLRIQDIIENAAGPSQQILKNEAIQSNLEDVAKIMGRIASGEAGDAEVTTFQQRVGVLKNIVENLPPDVRKDVKSAIAAMLSAPLDESTGTDAGNLTKTHLEFMGGLATGGVYNLLKGVNPMYRLKRAAKLKPLADFLAE